MGVTCLGSFGPAGRLCVFPYSLLPSPCSVSVFQLAARAVLDSEQRRRYASLTRASVPSLRVAACLDVALSPSSCRSRHAMGQSSRGNSWLFVRVASGTSLLYRQSLLKVGSLFQLLLHVKLNVCGAQLHASRLQNV